MASTDNFKYVKRSRGLVIRYDFRWEDDLKRTNCGKNGAPFRYVDAMIMFAASLRTVLSVPYRQLSGMLEVMMMMEGHDSPCYSQLYKRIACLDVVTDIGDDIVTVSDRSSGTVLVADATGLKQSNRGEWIRKKWKVQRGFVKLHLLVDANTKKILAVAVTDDRTGDSPVLKSLLGTALEANSDADADRPMAVIRCGGGSASTDAAHPGPMAQHTSRRYLAACRSVV